MTAALLTLALPCLALTPAPATAPTPAADRTTPAEARRVDQVPTPALHWTTCRQTAECATVQLPLDYDDPQGASVEVALLRIAAKDPGHRLGTLFVNPGGPGDSAQDLAVQAPQFLSEDLLERFDVVGVDPRGVGGSRQIRCFADPQEQSRALAPLTATPFPVTADEQRAWTDAARTLGGACSTTAGPIASAMSTTDDARDLDVLRRAVGDTRLSFLGLSYGSYLGQVYANLFPDRVRALAIDGVVDPQAWVGTPTTASRPVFERMGSAAASYRALHELLTRCQQVGPQRCSFADTDTQARFDRLADRLRTRPLRLVAADGTVSDYTYARLIADTGQRLRDPEGYRDLFADLTDLAQLTAPGEAAPDTTGPDTAAVVRRFLLRRVEEPSGPGYDNRLEAVSGVVCADGLHAADAASWPAAADAADRRSPYFGALWAWSTVQCAQDTWTARDGDVYRGPFNRRTAAPVLVVGSTWDPATSYDSAVKVARLLPDSRLVASDNWGHGALLTSGCVTDAMYGYLLHPLAPAPATTRCRGDVQPFAPATG
ncbi:alpha/beta hydrolase [Kitasatospora nipponensis]|uniref:Alpha/beta hydrolase n=1 Tax=Kitasatospora nipponensis TaxID=258049 RepID=A0ABN1VWY3_9ACTN